MAPKSILVTGASGYIGGAFLATLLDGSNEWVSDYHISVLVRTKDQADFACAKNITPVLFESFDESELLTRIGQDFDSMSSPGAHLSVLSSTTVIVHTGQGWHPTAAKSLISGQEKRQRELGQKVHFLSISGTSNFSDRLVTGEFIDNRVKSDEEDMYAYEKYRESFEHYPQRTTDVTIVEHGERAGVPTYIVIPPIIHGTGRGEFNKFTFQLPTMVAAAKKYGYVAMIGEGRSVYNHIHVEDIASLLNTLLARIHNEQEIPSGKQKRGAYVRFLYAQALATVLKERGLIESDEVKSLDLPAVADLYMPGLPLTLGQLPFAGRSSHYLLRRKLTYQGCSGPQTRMEPEAYRLLINLGQEVDDCLALTATESALEKLQASFGTQ
ncbi:unnamed protein product [Clonostachys rhizophaga]|uniref:NAD-dependent epimerase/dehydratase domain-containing protein n=1 Tax=Clonostachys rhizophaga TaxID=160324 RepID=A0A9N9W4D0_9HYPO|nr:unnamed protein product [Clonostachys rhizophaga]